MYENYNSVADYNLFLISSLQFEVFAFYLVLLGFRIFAHIWGTHQISFIDIIQWSLIFYGTCWFFLYADQEVVLNCLSICCIFFSLVSCLFLRQLKKNEKSNSFVPSRQNLIRLAFNIEHYKKLKDLMQKAFEKRLKKKDINLIWEIPFICFFLFNLVLVWGICIPYIQKVFFLRLAFATLVFNTWDYILTLCFIESVFVLFLLHIQKYFNKIYGENCKIFYNKENFVLGIKKVFATFVQSFSGSVFVIYGYLFFYWSQNMEHLRLKKLIHYHGHNSYDYAHSGWEKYGKHGVEPILDPSVAKIDLNSSLFEDSIDSIDYIDSIDLIELFNLFGLNYKSFYESLKDFSLMLNVSDVINVGLKVRELLIFFLSF